MRILVAGLAKTGTTGLLYLIANSFSDIPKIIFEPKKYEEDNNVDSINIVCKILLSGEIDYRSFNSFDKKVTIVRDPRDRLISSLLYSQFHGDYLGNEKKVERVRKCLARKEKNPSSLSIMDILKVVDSVSVVKNATRSYASSANALAVLDTYLNKFPESFLYPYENFVNRNYAALESYLGFSLVGNAEVPVEVSRVNRTKGSGDWRNWFTKRDVDDLRPVFSPWLKKYGYDADDWDLNDEPVIQPECCSGYFMRLVREANENSTMVERRNMKVLKGRVARATPRVIAGWAVGATPERPIHVALYVDGKKIAHVLADKDRPNFKSRGLHPTGCCGFNFHFNKEQELPVGTIVEVRPLDGKFKLANSPCVVE